MFFMLFRIQKSLIKTFNKGMEDLGSMLAPIPEATKKSRIFTSGHSHKTVG